MAASPQPKALAFKSVDNGRNIDAKYIHEAAVNHCVGNPPPEDTEVKELVVKTEFVVLGMPHEGFFSVLKVKNGVVNDWDTGHVHVVHLVDERLVEGLATEDRGKAEPILGHYIQDVFVKAVADDFSIPAVSFTAMDE